MAHKKEYYFNLGCEAAKTGKACTYKGGWQRKAWLAGYESNAQPAETPKAAAERKAKEAKAKMAASHPDHGGTNAAFRQAHYDWKQAQARAAAM